MITVNMNKQQQEQGISYKEASKYLKKLKLERRELKLKSKMGMPMTRKEEDKLRTIENKIEYCESVMDWMVRHGEKTYIWPID